MGEQPGGSHHGLQAMHASKNTIRSPKTNAQTTISSKQQGPLMGQPQRPHSQNKDSMAKNLRAGPTALKSKANATDANMQKELQLRDDQMRNAKGGNAQIQTRNNYKPNRTQQSYQPGMHQNAGHSSNDIYVKSHSTTPLALQGGGPAPLKNAANMDAQMQARMNEYLNSGVNMDQPAANNNK